jgi:DNA-binding transcriptional LysR family regulator
LTEHAHAARVVLRTNNVVGALDCAAAGIGIAVAPVFMAVRDTRLLRLPMPREIGVSPAYLVTHRDLANIPRVRATLDRLFRSLKEHNAP